MYEEAMYSMQNNLHASEWRSHVFYAEQSTCKWMKKPCILVEQSTCKWMKKPCILCGTVYMQVDEEAMYSMWNHLHASGWRSHVFYEEQSLHASEWRRYVFYAEQSTCKWMKKPYYSAEQSTCKWMKKPCILCRTIYMQVDEEAMHSMQNNIHASGWRSHVFYAEQSTLKWMKKPCILCGTIDMQVDEEAMYSMRNNLHASGWRSHVFYAEQSTCKWMIVPHRIHGFFTHLHVDCSA